MKIYTETLGFTEKIFRGEGDERAVMLDTGDGNYLEIFANGSAGQKPEGAITHFALRTSDADTAIERTRAAGAKITTAPLPFDIPNQPRPTVVRLAFFEGPDGEVIKLLHNDAL